MSLPERPRVSEQYVAGLVGDNDRVGSLQQLPLVLVDQLGLRVVAGTHGNNGLPEQIRNIVGILGGVKGNRPDLSIYFCYQLQLALRVTDDLSIVAADQQTVIDLDGRVQGRVYL